MKKQPNKSMVTKKPKLPKKVTGLYGKSRSMPAPRGLTELLGKERELEIKFGKSKSPIEATMRLGAWLSVIRELKTKSRAAERMLKGTGAKLEGVDAAKGFAKFRHELELKEITIMSMLEKARKK